MPNKIVLVAEDEPVLWMIIHVELEDCGIEVHRARDGEEAIAFIEEQRPDLLLLDLRMPKVDGFGVLEHMRGQGHDFPVVVLSNVSEQEQVQRAKDLGVKEYIVKSNIDWDDIGTVIERQLGETVG